MHRIEVRLKSHLPDARGQGLVKDIYDLGIASVSDVRVVDIYWLDAAIGPANLDSIGRNLLADPVTQLYSCQQGLQPGRLMNPGTTPLRSPITPGSPTRLRTVC